MLRRASRRLVLVGWVLLAAACTRQTAETSPRAVEAATNISPAPASSTPPASPASPALAVVDAGSSPHENKAAEADAATASHIAVKVATIGMHVGGGPYDEPTKEPIRRSVEPRFADLAQCWRHVTKPAASDVGVDLVIEASGGHAKVSNPRTSVTSEGFVPCVVAFFESVDFQKPKNGKTVVSYSVRFTP